MSHPLKVLELLSAADREALESFARERHRTVNALLDWVQAHGYRCSRSAVYSWRERFVMEDRFGVCNQAARALIEAAANSGGAVIAEAATRQLHTMLFESMLRLQSRGKVEVKDLDKIARALRNATATQGVVEDLRARFDQKIGEIQGKNKKPGGAISPEEIAEARKAIFGS